MLRKKQVFGRQGRSHPEPGPGELNSTTVESMTTVLRVTARDTSTSHVGR